MRWVSVLSFKGLPKLFGISCLGSNQNVKFQKQSSTF